MASSTIESMYDVALKPQLLRSLLKEYVPDQKHQFRSPSVLSYVVSTIKTHQLLSESAPPKSDQNLIDNWISAVDSWINRLLALASSLTPDKSWAGICLLGVTCQECSKERFLASYSAWFTTLLLHIQSPADSHFVKVASCASMSDLLTRLGGFSNAKKDGMSLATKLIQPLLKLLNEVTFDVVWEEAICLLCTILDIFPSSVQRHYDGVEAAVVLRLMSGKCSSSMLKKLGCCLALLPKSSGDEDSWLLMMQKILLSINIQLNGAFQGLEQDTRGIEAMRLLLSPGKDPPPPLGGQTLSRETSDDTMRRPEHLLISRISTLIFCCCKMLTSSYSFRVAIPVRPLVALAQRVLMVDGSSSSGTNPYMNTMKQELICAELPVLHSHTLELLTATVKGLSSQLLPHVGSIIRMLTDYFQTSAFPELRIKVYTIMKVLLMTMGVGIAAHLTEVVVNNALMDLDERGISSDAKEKLNPEATKQTSRKKRKHGSTSSLLEDQPDRDAVEVEMSPNTASLSVKIAALEALEALLTVGGAWRTESWRANVDHLLLDVAKSSCKGGWAKDDIGMLVSGSPTTIFGDYQIAALRAFLASLLSPGRIRPPHLSEGFELFRRGTQEIGTKVAEYCGHALLALEVLIHPRALPLLDIQSVDYTYEVRNKRFRGNVPISGHTENTQFHIGMLRQAPDEPDSDNDDLYEGWLRSGEDLETEGTDPGKETDKSKQPSETLRDPSSGNIPSDFDTNDKSPRKRDEIMVESQLSEETRKFSDEILPSKFASIADGKSSSQSSAIASGRTVLNPRASEDPTKDVAEAKDDGFASRLSDMSAKASISNRGKGLMYESDNESMESIPDIVDAEPDSD